MSLDCKSAVLSLIFLVPRHKKLGTVQHFCVSGLQKCCTVPEFFVPGHKNLGTVQHFCVSGLQKCCTVPNFFVFPYPRLESSSISRSLDCNSALVSS